MEETLTYKHVFDSTDIFELTHYFLKKYNQEYHQKKRITPEGFKVLHSYPFQGNVRELKNILKQAVVMIEKNTLDRAALLSLLGISEPQVL
jgi:DNA-binding NtrC family response regulator